MLEPILSVSDAVAVLNQTLDAIYPTMTIVGELANFKVSKNRWIYADLKDEGAKLRCFGTVYQLPGPLEDGMMLEIIAEPRIHPQFGFSLTIRSMRPVGEGSIRKAADLLRLKLEAEGLFSAERKRPIPYAPVQVGLIASEQSAAYADFIKILHARWQGVEISLYDVQVQGESAPETVVQAVDYFNQQATPPEVLVVIRGGGSADDLAAFSTEQVTRAIAGSRIPTVVAIGHEIDESLAELAADLRASTPSNAAELLFPDKEDANRQLQFKRKQLQQTVAHVLEGKSTMLQDVSLRLSQRIETVIEQKSQTLKHATALLESMHPKATLRRGYAIVESAGKLVSSVQQLKPDTQIKVSLQDGSVEARIEEV